MINNSNQDIRTDYRAQDVFVPNAANQLARAVPYDFVITQDILDKYIGQHPAITEIDVGDLIACDPDGNDGTWDTPVPAPVSICLACKTSLSDTYCFDFGGRLLSDILDCSAYQSGGTWDSTLTVDMVSVYSTHPYRLKELVAGINFWSTPETVVSIVGSFSNNSGVTKVGTYATEGNYSLYDLGEADFLQIVCKYLSTGTYFKISPSKAHLETGYRVAVVYADWMTGASSLTKGYRLPENASSSPGLFQQLTETIKYGTEPVVFVQGTYSTAPYRLSYHDSTVMRLSNADTGNSFEVTVLGDITWKQLSTSGGRAVISDLDTSAVIPYVPNSSIPHKYIVGGSNNLDSLSVMKAGFTGFLTPKQDMGRVHPGGTSVAPDWYNAYPGFSFEGGNVTTLEWYFWYAISDFEDDDDTTLVWRKNSRVNLQVDTGSLKEGIVYEIDCHVISLPSGPLSAQGNPEYPDYSVGNNPPMIYGKQATPVTSYYTEGVLDCISLDLKPSITFIGFTGGTSDVGLWGLPDRQITNEIYPAFYAAPEPNFGAKNIVDAAIQLKDLARAKVLFTYLGGKVYVMSY